MIQRASGAYGRRAQAQPGRHQRDGEAAIACEPARGRRRQRRVEAPRGQADQHAEQELELAERGRPARRHQAETEQNATAQDDGARAEPVGERAPQERADAHGEPVEERRGEMPVRDQPIASDMGWRKTPSESIDPDPDAGDDDAGADDDPAVEDLHGSSRPPSRRPSPRRPGTARRPRATASGSGASGDSWDRSSSQAKNRTNGRRCCVTWSRIVPRSIGIARLERVEDRALRHRRPRRRASPRRRRAPASAGGPGARRGSWQRLDLDRHHGRQVPHDRRPAVARRRPRRTPGRRWCRSRRRTGRASRRPSRRAAR